MATVNFMAYVNAFIDYVKVTGPVIASTALMSQYMIDNWAKIPLFKKITNKYLKNIVASTVTYYICSSGYTYYLTSVKKVD